MMNATQISEMTRDEKLRAMEALWANLAEDDATLESPEWHQEVLKETETRLKSGEEKVLDWADAKRVLRKRCE